MLVSHRYRFIYTKTLKTAGTSVESFFERFCMPDGEWEMSHARDEYVSPTGIIGFRGVKRSESDKWWNHMPAAAIKRQLGEEIWNSYFKFCVVRNPFDKCISAFEHFGKGRRTGLNALLSTFRTIGMTSDQRRFLAFVKNSPPVDCDKYIMNGEFCLNDVIRYESLESDIDRICKILSIEFDPKFLPRLKGKTRRPNATPQALYTAKARQQVASTFEFELKHFGYEFPLSTP